MSVQGAVTRVVIMFETAAGDCDALTCPAGAWTIPVNVTTGSGSASHLTIPAVYVCRVNSSGVSQQTIGSLTGLSQNVDGAGVVSFSVTNGAAATFSTGDRVAIVIVATNIDPVAWGFNFKPDQVVTTPMASSVKVSSGDGGAFVDAGNPGPNFLDAATQTESGASSTSALSFGEGFIEYDVPFLALSALDASSTGELNPIPTSASVQPIVGTDTFSFSEQFAIAIGLVDGGTFSELVALGPVASDAITLAENLTASFAFGTAESVSESEIASSSATPQSRDSRQILDSNPISNSTVSDQDAGREVEFGIAGVSNFQFISSDQAVFSEVVLVVKNGPPSRIFTVKGSIDTTFNVQGN